MDRLHVNPNRMELLKLRRRLDTSQRGHKLLKDKLDELMKAFLQRISENRKLRARVEKRMVAGYALMALARAQSSEEALGEALATDGTAAALVEVTTQSVMSVPVPVLHVGEISTSANYSYALTPAVLDGAIVEMSGVFPLMLELAGHEKAIELLAVEIESTRRRVNALEHVLIPQIEDAIRSIRAKIDESDRSERTRLMKVKEMLADA
jgi:V/A-type H+-transporting ATPase subunit D